ncbi:hypothetical protein [Mesorhizobium abyssinicae]|uniref:hypothetical protein n=1 Tax=Mesorhizobium abyssinicae TaxID=1209958 RepID=UPI0033986DCF
MSDRLKAFGQWLAGMARADIPAMRQNLLWALLLLLIGAGWAYIRYDPKEISIDFNDVQGCSQGKLADIAKRQLDGVDLTNGADALIICDNQSLKTVRKEMPRALANRIPGCLDWSSWETGGLVLVRKSSAVCSLPGGKQFVCDGANARHGLGANAVGDSTKDAISSCSDAVLKKFGFQS